MEFQHLHSRSDHDVYRNGSERNTKRQKIKVACQECRDRKIRCDGGRPVCGSCSRKNMSSHHCVYLSADVPSADSYVRGLEARVQELESLNHQVSGHSMRQSHSDPQPVSSNATGTPGSSMHSDGRWHQIGDLAPEPSRTYSNYTAGGANAETRSEDSPAFLGSSSAVGFMAEVSQTFRSADEVDRDIESISSTALDGFAASSWFGDSRAEDRGLASLTPEFMIPPRPIADKLLHSYWIGAHPLQPFVHRRSFMKRFWSISRPKEAPIPAKTEENFLTRATNVLSLDSTDNPSVQLVQALLLMIQYLQNRNLSNRAWVLLGMAIRVAQAIGLHMDIFGESQEKREERRKTWSNCVLLDRMQSMTFGRPLMLGSIVICPVPQMIDEEFLATDPATPDAPQPHDIPAKTAYFVCVLQLSSITAETLQLSYSPVHESSEADQLFVGYSTLFRIEEALESWHEELPSFLHYDNAKKPTDMMDLLSRQTHLLHHRYLHSKILLFRRVVVQLAANTFSKSSTMNLTAVQQSMASTCVAVCTSAAQELLEVIQPHLGTVFVPPAWFTIFVIYTAGTVLAIVFLTPTFHQNLTSEQMERLHQSWSRCIECLKWYEKQGISPASKCLWNLRKMRGVENIKNRVESLRQTTSNIGEESDRLHPAGPATVYPHQPTDHEFPIMEEGGLWNLMSPSIWWPEDDIDCLIELAHAGQ